MSLLLLLRGASGTVTTSTGVVVEFPRQRVEHRLALALTHADGRVSRLGPDEFDPHNIPTGLTFSTSIPGGFKDGQFTLLRRIDQNYPDLNLLDDAKVYGAGGEVAFEGRVAQIPRSHGDQSSIRVGAVGWSSHLKDDSSFREVYVDRDFGGWDGPGASQEIGLVSTWSVNGTRVAWDSSQSALVTEFQGGWSRRPISEAWNDAGVKIGSIYYAWRKNANTGSAGNWDWRVLAANNDVATSYDDSGNLTAAGPSTGTLTTTGGDKRYGVVQFKFIAAPDSSTDVNFQIFWTCLALYGTHGLTKQGTSSATEAQGFYASNVIADIVSRAAPKLTYTLGGSIQATGFVIPHLAFKEPTTAEQAILSVNAYHLWEWGVYEGREFFFRPPDPDRVCWEARLSEGAQLDLEGDELEDIYNGVIVRFNQPDGKQRIVGPVGSGFDQESTALQDTSPENPVNAHGIPKRWAVLDLSFVSTLDGATQIGTAYLAEKSLPQRRGSLVLKGGVRHPTKGLRPAWSVRAGDYIRVPDFPVDVPRRIIETSYSHDGRTLTATIGNQSAKLDAILERLGVQMQGVIS